MKIKLICQVKNSFEYLPSFLAHHEALFDEIHIIDQCSKQDLRALNQQKDGIYFYRTTYAFFNAMIATSAILEFKELRHSSDFVFVLDIDEYLPFSERNSFESFLNQNTEYDAIRFHWKNGLNFSSDTKGISFIDHESDLRFLDRNSSVFKLAYNTQKTPWFIPLHGNHDARFHMTKFAGLRKKPKIHDVDIPLYHIPFASKANLEEKVQSFDKKEFQEKIIDRHEATKEIFSRILTNQSTEDDLCFFTANYRTIGREDIIKISAKNFIYNNPFKDKESQIYSWKEALKSCPKVKHFPAPEDHEHQALTAMGKKTWGGRHFLYQLIKNKLFINQDHKIGFTDNA